MVKSIKYESNKLFLTCKKSNPSCGGANSWACDSNDGTRDASTLCRTSCNNATMSGVVVILVLVLEEDMAWGRCIDVHKDAATILVGGSVAGVTEGRTCGHKILRSYRYFMFFSRLHASR